MVTFPALIDMNLWHSSERSTDPRFFHLPRAPDGAAPAISRPTLASLSLAKTKRNQIEPCNCWGCITTWLQLQWQRQFHFLCDTRRGKCTFFSALAKVSLTQFGGIWPGDVECKYEVQTTFAFAGWPRKPVQKFANSRRRCCSIELLIWHPISPSQSTLGHLPGRQLS